MKYEAILRNVRNAVDELKRGGITIRNLDEALAELETHAKNLNAVEHGLEAIRQEVLEPVQAELAQNKTAGTFSIWGFWVGLVSIVLSIGLTIWDKALSPRHPPVATTASAPSTCLPCAPIADAGSDASTPELETQIDSCSRLGRRLDELSIRIAGIPDSYAPRPGEVEVATHEDQPLLRSDDGVITIRVYDVREIKQGDKVVPVAGVYFHLNKREIGDQAARQLFRVDRRTSDELSRNGHGRAPLGALWFAEGDRVVYRDRAAWDVVRVFRMRSETLPVADSRDGILLRPTAPPPRPP